MYATREPDIETWSPEHLWGVLIMVSIADIATTMFALDANLATEANPVAAAAISATGLWALIPIKLLMLAVWHASFQLIPRRYELGFLAAGTAYFGAIVFVNIGVIGTRLGAW